MTCPFKRRYLHPRLMPKVQADAYDLAQMKLANGGPGAALKMLHHIRSVSVHPGDAEATQPDQFIAKSARLDAVIDILRKIKQANERVLVFIEHRDMHFRFGEIVRHMFGLEEIDVINGATPDPSPARHREPLSTTSEDGWRFRYVDPQPKVSGHGVDLDSRNPCYPPIPLVESCGRRAM